LQYVRAPTPARHVSSGFARKSFVAKFAADGELGLFSRLTGFHLFALGKRQVTLNLFIELFVLSLAPPKWESHVSLSFFAGFMTPATLPYSYRSATSGSTCVARLAGM
jgi:hypothetical protein